MLYVIPVEIIKENRQIPTYFSSIRGQKFGPQGLFYTPTKNTYNMPVNHVLGCGIKNFLRKLFSFI